MIWVLIKRWYPITISITITTTVLAMNNTWIIPQCQIGLDSMLNGIEYAILGFFLIIIRFCWRVYDLDFWKE